MKIETLTAVNRIVDVDLPTVIQIGKEEIKLPKCLLKKDIHYLIDSNGACQRAAWVSKTLVMLINAVNAEDSETKKALFAGAYNLVLEEISTLVKSKLIPNKSGPGAMSFSQCHENVPQGSIVISKRTFEELKRSNSKWAQGSSVIATRFPNLGPGTTMRLKLIVDAEPMDVSSPLAIGARISNLQELLNLVESNEDSNVGGFLDAFYLNPKDLKDGMEGDGDGDLIYLKLDGKAGPRFSKINRTRKPAPIDRSLVDKMIAKASRVDRSNLQAYLPKYFDKTPIGEATYAIRFLTFLQAHKLKKTSLHPMQEAWAKTNKVAIDLIEFVMDIRKGEFTDAQIMRKLNFIQEIMNQIAFCQTQNNWFAKTVTSNSIIDPDQFIRRFPTLQEYIDFVFPTKQQV